MSAWRLSRRRFVGAAVGAVAAGGLTAACSDDTEAAGRTTGDDDLDQALEARDLPTIEWDLATSWSPSLDVIHGGAEFFADQVARMTGGRLRITPTPAGALAPAREILQNVGAGAVPLGHTASNLHIGLDPITQLSTAVPFGMTARQHQSWLYDGDGLALLAEIYRERFGVVPLPAGNTGAQMGGWFRRELTGLGDLDGLRMRIVGIGAAVLARLGVSVELVPDGDVTPALGAGEIDAAAWIGPHDDRSAGLHTAASVYHYPGWWAPGSSLDVVVHAARFDRLPEEYQAVLEAAAGHAYNHMLARYDTLNAVAMADIVASGVSVQPFPDDVLDAAASTAEAALELDASADDGYRAVLDSYRRFHDAVGPWHALAERSMLDLLAGGP